jgi:hypothetical protein
MRAHVRADIRANTKAGSPQARAGSPVFATGRALADRGSHLLEDETRAVEAARDAAAYSFMTNDGGRMARPPECRSARALR